MLIAAKEYLNTLLEEIGVNVEVGGLRGPLSRLLKNSNELPRASARGEELKATFWGFNPFLCNCWAKIEKVNEARLLLKLMPYEHKLYFLTSTSEVP